MEINSQQAGTASAHAQTEALADRQFRIDAVPPGSALLVGDVAVFNVDGTLCATQAKCPHRQALLTGNTLHGSTVTCPWHGSQFNACTGAVLRGPAVVPLKTYRVIVEGEMGRVEEKSDGAGQPDTSLR